LAAGQDGKAIETQKFSGYWSDDELLVPAVKPDIPTTFDSSGTSKSDSVLGPGRSVCMSNMITRKIFIYTAYSACSFSFV